MWKTRLSGALMDLLQGMAAMPLWSTLGWQEVRQRYRRSWLGPFWITISTGAMIAGMGPLYSRLLGQQASWYVPYIAVGLVMWNFLSSLTMDACQTFIGSETYIKNLRLPLTTYVMRQVWRNLIIFGHNFVIVLIVYLIFRPPPSWELLLVPVSIALICVNGVWVGLLLGTLCARFRDVPQIVNSLVQVTFFLTPVLWRADMLGRNAWAADLNPYYHFLEIVRAPLLGASASAQSWWVVVGITLVGYAVTMLFFGRFRPRVAYWV